MSDIFNVGPGENTEREIRRLKESMKENFARAKELELRVKGFIVGSIVAPLIMVIISKFSDTPMTMNYGTAMMTGILIIVVSLLVAYVFSQAEPE